MKRRSWEESFQHLHRFRAQHGHCHVPRRPGRSDRLASWLHVQRRLFREGRLSSERIRALERIGFAWSVRENTWEALFSRFVDWRKRHGHADVPKHLAEDPALGTWVVTQRQSAKRGLLSPDQVRRLARAGLIWDPHRDRWEARFAELCSVARRQGHTRIPLDYDEGLRRWVTRQRKAFRHGTLDQKRVARLDAIGFEWYPSLGMIPRSHRRAGRSTPSIGSTRRARAGAATARSGRRGKKSRKRSTD